MALLWAKVKQWLINGVVVTIPLVITLIVLSVVVNFLLRALSPVVAAIGYAWSNEPSTAVLQLVTILALVGLILVIGFIADQTPGGRVSGAVHETMETIPGVSAIYGSVRQASEIFLDDDTDQFQDVKLVEFPNENSHMLGFLTGDTADEIEHSLGAEMVTIMVPLGPNPTTNGFVMHVPTEHVTDVEMNVEEAITAIATLGIATETGGTT
ncbi:DUF502 domain-containing protein [Saliphagus infecundisoli]|uniref:DUF502 domain-containing protein n=1 Tax=Saliphagus infecundisoli TaxID=1849069 RepID=A0ABD5QH41_9EURY|nr:DUF502 domain-containing protein [Saliphagus infecundisoli]